MYFKQFLFCTIVLLTPTMPVKLENILCSEISNCQARVRSPKVQSPKVKTERTWAETIITWATTTPPHHPITFKHEGGLW